MRNAKAQHNKLATGIITKTHTRAKEMKRGVEKRREAKRRKKNTSLKQHRT